LTNSALLIIDMQNDLCRDERRREKVDEMLPHLQQAIDAFANHKQLVIYSYFALRPDDEQFKRFGDRYCIEGTPGAEIIAELQPLRGPTLRKAKHSAFFETELDSLLKQAEVRDLYLAGLQTHICIMTTAADASYRGYRAIAIEECVVSTQATKKEFALDWIREYVGEVHTLEQVTRNILDNA
jgi:nicotinamidase-related amidase